MEEVKRSPFKGLKNVYLCDCGHGFVSIDIDDGTTPFLARCMHPGCGMQAASLCYKVPQSILASTKPALEWYRPDAETLAREAGKVEEAAFMRTGNREAARAIAQQLHEHVRMGGLLPRDPRVPTHASDCECADCWRDMQ